MMMGGKESMLSAFIDRFGFLISLSLSPFSLKHKNISLLFRR